jgi:hypothetical protein
MSAANTDRACLEAGRRRWRREWRMEHPPPGVCLFSRAFKVLFLSPLCFSVQEFLHV